MVKWRQKKNSLARWELLKHNLIFSTLIKMTQPMCTRWEHNELSHDRIYPYYPQITYRSNDEQWREDRAPRAAIRLKSIHTLKWHSNIILQISNRAIVFEEEYPGSSVFIDLFYPRVLPHCTNKLWNSFIQTQTIYLHFSDCWNICNNGLYHLQANEKYQ